MRVGFIGLGVMGGGMARLLLEAGHDLTVHDRSSEAVAPFVERGARSAETPRAAAEASEVVFTSLPGPNEVRAVFFEPEKGLLSGLRPGSVYVDTTTNLPSLIREIADACRAKRAELLDAPVSGRPPEMTIMAGGPESALEKCRPLLECIGKRIFHVGENGQGMVMKIVNQYLFYSNITAAIEGVLMGVKAGLDIRTMVDIVSVSSGNSWILGWFTRALLENDPVVNTGSGSVSNIITKDVDLALGLSSELHTPSHVLSAVREILSLGEKRALYSNDLGIIANTLEEMAGVSLLPTPSK